MLSERFPKALAIPAGAGGGLPDLAVARDHRSLAGAGVVAGTVLARVFLSEPPRVGERASARECGLPQNRKADGGSNPLEFGRWVA